MGSEEILWINDQDMSAFDLWVEMPTGWYDGPLYEVPGTQVAGRAGIAVVSSDVVAGPRDISIPARLICNTPEDTLLRLDQLKRLYDGAYVHIRFDGWPDRECLCRVRQIVPALQGLPGDSDGGQIIINARADSPFLRARRFETYVLRPGTEAGIIPGSAPSDISIRFDGPANGEINLVYHDIGGVPRAQLVLDGAPLLLGESLFVDGNSPYGEIVRRNAAGVETPAHSYLSPLGHYITIHPRWSAPEEELYGYLTLDTGSAVITHRRWFT